MPQSFKFQYEELIDLCNKLMDGHISYKLGGKISTWQDEPSHIKKLDCSGFVYYVIRRVSKGRITIPDGSWWQKKWCHDTGLRWVDYDPEAAKEDGRLRIAFMDKDTEHKTTTKVDDEAGHVWLVLNGQTLECYGGKGPGRRAWNTPILKDNVDACFELGITWRQHTARSKQIYVATTTLSSLNAARVSSQTKNVEAELDEIHAGIKFSGEFTFGTMGAVAGIGVGAGLAAVAVVLSPVTGGASLVLLPVAIGAADVLEDLGEHGGELLWDDVVGPIANTQAIDRVFLPLADNIGIGLTDVESAFAQGWHDFTSLL